MVTRRRRRKRRTKRANPRLAIIGNPHRRRRRKSPGTVIGRPLYLEYTHAENGKAYYHNFARDTEVRALRDGSVLIRNPRGTMWEDDEL